MLVKTEQLTREVLAGMDEATVHQVYCGLDTCVTLEVFEQLQSLIAGREPLLYSFERAMQAPALDMMQRGFLIDGYERQKGIANTKWELEIIKEQLNELAQSVWNRDLNANSPKQLKEFFYGAMRMPEVWLGFKGQKKLSTNREALEKLDIYLHARPFVTLIIEARDLVKRLSVLETEVNYNGRMTTSYNIGGTNTGRWSSSSDVTGVGTNLQNITPDLRRMFIADKGMKMVGIDLEQAESREVGFLCGILFNDWSYLDACEGGDLHTATAKLIWPDIVRSREDADRKFYRDFSYRDASKRGGHGSNYMGTPFTMARNIKVPVRIMEEFQDKYFEAFKCIPRWHRWVAEQIQRTGRLTTPMGRSRQFFGRSDDDATLRKAIAFSPQASTGDRLNLGLWRIWKHMPEVELLAQVHDAVYFQYPEHMDEGGIVRRALELVRVETVANGRKFVVPGEAKVGWNWAAFSGENTGGLMKWKQGWTDPRVSPIRGKDRIL